MIDQFYQHEPRHSLEWKGIQDAPFPFLYQSDLALYFWHMFLCSCGYEVSELLELIVHQDCAHLKSSASVQIHHPGDAGAASCFAVRLGVNSVITKFRPLAMLTRNGTPLTKMMSTANVTS
jgi:hypothetical protein